MKTQNTLTKSAEGTQSAKVALFKQWYRAEIEKKVKSLKKSGTTAMGADNRFTLVRVPNNTEGAPVGANACWLLRQYFNEAVVSSPRLLIDFVF